LISVTQADTTPLAIGQNVLVINGGQARVVPDYTVKLPSKAPEKAAEKPKDKPKDADVKPADSDKPKDTDAKPADSDKPADDKPADPVVVNPPLVLPSLTPTTPTKQKPAEEVYPPPVSAVVPTPTSPSLLGSFGTPAATDKPADSTNN